MPDLIKEAAAGTPQAADAQKPQADAKATPDPAAQEKTPEQLNEEAIAALDSWYANPSDETKETVKQKALAAKDALSKAKATAAEAAKKAEAEAKKTAEEAAKNKPPERYNFVLPEKSLLTPALTEKVASLAKEYNLSQEKAQKFVVAQNEMLAEFVKHNSPDGEGWNKRLDEWEGLYTSDPEVGGGNKDTLLKNAELGKRVLMKFFDKEVAEEIYRTGYGSHPGFIRGFIRIGKAMGEDTFHPAGPNTSDKKPIEEVFYGKQPAAQT